MAQTETERRERIRELNDKLRKTAMGGTTYSTRGVQCLLPETINKIMTAIRSFDDFTEHNDPYGEHDCAAVEIDGNRIFWKIDYYDQSMQGGSPDPTDPKVTERVMTVMLAEEY